MLRRRSRGAFRGRHSVFSKLTHTDYDMLYVAVCEQIPQVTRQMFPAALRLLVGWSVLEITVTSDEITVQMRGAPEIGIYRVQRICYRAGNRQG